MKKPYTKFTDENLPRVPNFVDANLPKFTPFALGPETSKAKPEINFIEAYFGGDLRPLLLDAQQRPEHYTTEQKTLLEILDKKKPLPPGAGTREINELVLRFVEKAEQRKKREEVVRQAQKTLDPTIDKKIEDAANEEEQRQAGQIFEHPSELKFIKII